MITTVYQGTVTEWRSRTDAMEYFQDKMITAPGDSEVEERCLAIYAQLVFGKDFCTDGGIR